MKRYLLILGLSLLLLWGGLAATTMGGNALLGENAIPPALTVARAGGSYRIAFLGQSVELGRAWLLGELILEEGMLRIGSKGFPLRRKLPLLRLDQIIQRRNLFSEEFFGRKRGGNGE